MADFTTTGGELSLQEMLADPIVQTMMDNDGVTREEVTDSLRAMRERMASRVDETHNRPRSRRLENRLPLGRARTDADASSPSTNPKIEKQPSEIG